MKQNVIVFGCGRFTKRILSKIEMLVNIVAVCDNNKLFWGTYFENKYLCISPKELYEIYNNIPVLISTEQEKFVREISLQLESVNCICQHVVEYIYEKNYNNGMLYFQNCIDEMLCKKIKKIFVLGAPAHSNLGDQAQSYCIEYLLRSNYPDYEVYIYEDKLIWKNYYELLYFLRQIIKQEDKIFIHSGYHCTDLFLKEEWLNEKIVNLFPDKRIVFLPQTIYFKNRINQEQSSKIFNAHKNILLMCRDEKSYQIAKKNYKNNKLLLFPDVVTSLIGRTNYDLERKGILVCFRNLKMEESGVNEEWVNNLVQKLKKIDQVVEKDTESEEHWSEIRKNRKKFIEKELEFYANFKLVITDRFHGMIFSLITDTPLLILPSTDHKLVYGARWFQKEKYKTIFISEDYNNIYDKAMNIYQNWHIKKNPDTLFQQYFVPFIKYVEEW